MIKIHTHESKYKHAHTTHKHTHLQEGVSTPQRHRDDGYNDDIHLQGICPFEAD